MAGRVTVLSVAQVDQVLAQPDIAMPLGVRDRTILELIWATAIRRSELVGLGLDAVALRDRALLLNRGGPNERALPLDDVAALWLQRYLTGARHRLVPEPHPVVWVPADTGVLFVNHDGGPLDSAWLDAQVSRYIAAAGFGPGSCHQLRFSAGVRIFEAAHQTGPDGREGVA